MSIALAIRLFLSTLFARAVWHKITQHQQFRLEMDAYKILPSQLIPFAAALLILLEVVCIGGLLFSNTVLLLALFLLALYSLVMAVNLLKGRRQIDCGCGGWLSSPNQLSGLLVLRNLILIGLGISSIYLSDYLTGTISMNFLWGSLLSAFTLWILYEASEQAISNWQHHKKWLSSRPIKQEAS